MAGYRIDPAEADSRVKEMFQVAEELQAEMKKLRVTQESSAGFWTGSSASATRNAHSLWDMNQTKLTTTLRALGDTITSAAKAYTEIDTTSQASAAKFVSGLNV